MQQPLLPPKKSPPYEVNLTTPHDAPIATSDDTSYGPSSTECSLESWQALKASLNDRLSSNHYAHKMELQEFLNKMLKPLDTPVLIEYYINSLRDSHLLDPTWNPRKTESPLCKSLAGALQLICSEFSKQKSQKSVDGLDGTEHPQAYGLQYSVISANKHLLRDGRPGLVEQPDLRLVISQPGEDTTPNWHDVILPNEIQGAKRGIDNQSTLLAMVLHSAQDSRLFSYSITFAFPRYQLHLWDRSGHLSSSSLDINAADGLEKIITFVGRLSLMTLREHGFDPTAFSVSSEKLHPPLRLPYYICHKSNVFFRLNSRKAVSSDLFGKETRCWNATKCSLPPGATQPVSFDQECIIKESWLREEQTVALPQGPSQPLADVDTSEDSNPLLNNNRWSSEGIKIEEATMPENWAYPGGYEAGIYTYLGQDKIPGLAEFGGVKKLESTFEDIPKHLGGLVYLSRTRHRVILFTVGCPLREASSPAVLLSAIRDIVDALEGLLRRGILHRDVSDTNCLLNPLSSGGFLTDLDHAIAIGRLEKDVREGRLHRTGTSAFMATGLLFAIPEVHNWAHAYESIFWLLLFIAAGSPTFCCSELAKGDPNGKVLSIFIQKTRDGTYDRKLAYLYRTRSAKTTTHPYFEALSPCLNELRTLFRLHRLDEYSPRSRPLDREEFRNVLTKWIDALRGHTFPADALQTVSDYRYRPPMKHFFHHPRKEPGSGYKSHSTQSPEHEPSTASTKRKTAQDESAVRKRRKLGAVGNEIGF